MCGLDCYAMPTMREDDALYDLDTRGVNLYRKGFHFAWTGQSLEKWVSEDDRQLLHLRGFVQRDFFCLPGTFFIGDEQVVFDRDQAIVVEEHSLI